MRTKHYAVFICLLLGSTNGLLAAQRIVTLGASITEITFALGVDDRIVAVDQSSERPAVVSALPRVGYVGAISSEGLLSVNPDLIIASSRLGPPAVVEQLRRSRIPIEIITNPMDADTLRDAIFRIAALVGKSAQGELLWKSIQEDLDAAGKQYGDAEPVRTVFLMGNAGIAMAAGRSTQANGMIELAGGLNLFDDYIGYKPVSEEALFRAQPDWLLVAAHNPSPQDDARVALQRIGLANLARDKGINVALIDLGSFLSFGPRTGSSVRNLAAILSGNETIQADSHE